MSKWLGFFVVLLLIWFPHTINAADDCHWTWSEYIAAGQQYCRVLATEGKFIAEKRDEGVSQKKAEQTIVRFCDKDR